MHTFIFGYGSLLNEASLQRILPQKTFSDWAMLQNWRRVFDKPGKTHAYPNLNRRRGQSVWGRLIEVTPLELVTLSRHEPSDYDLLDVTDAVREFKLPEDSQILAFVAAPPGSLPMKADFIERIEAGLTKEERKRFWDETDTQGRNILP